MNIFFLLIVFLPLAAFGQFQNQGASLFPQPSAQTPQTGDSTDSGFLGLSLSHLTTRQSASFMMMSGGGQPLGGSAFTNSFVYDFSPSFRARADLSLLYSPFSTLGSTATNQINGLQLSNVSLNYSPMKNMNIVVSMQRGPMMNGFMGMGNTLEDEQLQPRDDEK